MLVHALFPRQLHLHNLKIIVKNALNLNALIAIHRSELNVMSVMQHFFHNWTGDQPVYAFLGQLDLLQHHFVNPALETALLVSFRIVLSVKLVME